MDWTSGIQAALDYVEEHLTDEIDYEMVAKQAWSSSFHFQRVFGILCGYSLGDYIRMRRLSLAAEDLTKGDERVLDVALRYGYETPESFSRAFAKFHGITPIEAKKGGKIKSFTRLSVKLILTGGSSMDYRIEKSEAFKVIGKKQEVAKPQGADAAADISAFWAECGKSGIIQRICGYFPGEPKLKGLLGICFSSENEGNRFPYGIGVEYDGREITDDDLEVFEIPAHTYAVFTCKGKMPEAFSDTYAKIVTEFFPQSNLYEYAEGVEIEVYPSENVSDPDYSCEIRIAVNEKSNCRLNP